MWTACSSPEFRIFIRCRAFSKVRPPCTRLPSKFSSKVLYPDSAPYTPGGRKAPTLGFLSCPSLATENFSHISSQKPFLFNPTLKFQRLAPTGPAGIPIHHRHGHGRKVLQLSAA